MSALPFLKIFPVCVGLAAVLLFSAPALAQSALPAAYAPWAMQQQEEKNTEEDKTQKKNNDTSEDQELALHDRALITPETTRTMLEKIGERNEQRGASPLEEFYSSRLVDDLSQFGYDMFGDMQPDDFLPVPERSGLPGGMPQDDFIVSSGDTLSVTFTGQRSERKTYMVDSQGFLLVDDIAPIPAAGLTLGEVREILEAEVSTLHNTDIFVTLDAIRQIDVLVMGHVEKPGRFTLTVYHTVLDALSEAGGIEKTGSLRQVRLVRQGQTTPIDLYELLTGGSSAPDIKLRDGDRIVVPPVGQTVAVSGSVKRPGIYEMTGEKLSLNEILKLGGGLLNPGQNRLIRLSLTQDGEEVTREVGGNKNAPMFGDGDILMVAPSLEKRSGTVELSGNTRRPGLHDINKAKTLSALIDSNKVLGQNIYPLIGVIERWDEKSLSRQIIEFSPLKVVQGDFDRKLQQDDVVHLFSTAQIMALQKEQDDQSPLVDVALRPPKTDEDKITDDPVIASFLRERAAYIRGAVRKPGGWPVAGNTSLASLIAAAGGLTLEASTSNVEISSKHQPEGHGTLNRFAVNFKNTEPENVIIGPGDTVRINQKFKRVDDKSVLIVGEVASPGRYDLVPGDTLSRLLQRAGGLTTEAYPEGAIFSRKSERKSEESRFRNAARDLERALAVAMEKEDEAPDAAQIAMARDLAAELRQVESVGRITVEADPGILTVQPELDILLEAGDRIYIPARPLTVRVSGEVLSPANLQFRKGKSPRDYIAEAGGFTYHADSDRAFVLYPDGSAQPLSVSSWNHKATFIPPGSTIVVPRDPKPFDFIQSAKDVSQILSNLAITGIFLDDIDDSD